MSGPGSTRATGKLRQTKLPFTSTPSAGASEKLSDLDTGASASDNKRIKRKMDEGHETEKDPKARRSECATAAENRMKELASGVNHASDFLTTNKENDSRKGKEEKQLEASTSAEGEGKAQDEMSDFQNESEDNESEHSSSQENEDVAETESSNSKTLGRPIHELNTAPKCLPRNLILDRSHNHDVLIKVPFEYSNSSLPSAFPLNYQDRWDENHVRMPCSEKNQYPVDSEGSPGELANRWDLIQQALLAPITDSFTLEEAILRYNQRYTNKWKFTALHHFFTRHSGKERQDDFFAVLLPEMIRLAVKLPKICTKSIPLLKKGRSTKKLTLSQQQIACLLANAFFCTFPRRNSRARGAEFSSYPDINFSTLFQGPPNSRKMEKLNCVINYFERVCYDMPKGIVTFSRQTVQSSYDWHRSQDCLRGLHVSSSGTIEDNGIGMLQVDFANKYLGGGVLGHGCVQEEIRFLICPEMIVTRLFTEALGDQDSLIMTGCEQFSKYNGYADSFRFQGNFQDETPRDKLGRLCCEVVAIDAMVFRSDYNKQFKTNSVLRELNKAYCGFQSGEKEAEKSAVCTGNWGCGAFGGDKQLKSLIQVMAASAARREVCYFTFGDEKLAEELYEIHMILTSNQKTIGDTVWLIAEYEKKVVSRSFKRPSIRLFDFIKKKFGYSDSDFSSSGEPQTFDEDSNEARNTGWDSAVDGASPDHKANTP
ncbi:poly(ADP-ribose) glycohydrolase-like isoform X2 [Littorina saxatilis]